MKQSSVGNFAALLRAAHSSQPTDRADLEAQRRLVADLCIMLGERARGEEPRPSALSRATSKLADATPTLSPRLAQTLEALLEGQSEKQIARELAISPHTVHVYVKTLYKDFGVSSRGELLARFFDQPFAHAPWARRAMPRSPATV
jgi:DNA-binding NarL/FixJ family response regulator